MSRAARNTLANAPLDLSHRNVTHTPHGTVGTNPALRESTVAKPYAWTGTRRHGNKRGADTKGQGHWRTVSQNLPDGRNPAWSLTKSDFATA